MPHVRKSIRDAIVTAVTGLGTTGSRVFPGRVYPLEDALELPGLLVYTENEDVSIDSIGVSRLQDRRLELIIEALFKDNASLDDKADTILAEVETALGPGAALGGGKWIELDRVEIQRDGDSEKAGAQLRMIYKIAYITALGAPTVAL